MATPYPDRSDPTEYAALAHTPSACWPRGS